MRQAERYGQFLFYTKYNWFLTLTLPTFHLNLQNPDPTEPGTNQSQCQMSIPSQEKIKEA